MGAGVGAAGSLAGTAGVSLINNKGDLGKVLSDSFSSDSLKQMAIASLTGGLTAEYFNSLSGADTHTKIVGGKTVADLSSWGSAWYNDCASETSKSSARLIWQTFRIGISS